VVMTGQVELVAGHEMAAVADAGDSHHGGLALADADLGHAIFVLEYFVQITGSFPAAGANPVEALRVAAGMFIELQFAAATGCQLVRYRARADTGHYISFRFELLMRELRVVIDLLYLARTQVLLFLPYGDPFLVTEATLDSFKVHR